jgi:hypothetical protein
MECLLPLSPVDSSARSRRRVLYALFQQEQTMSKYTPEGIPDGIP